MKDIVIIFARNLIFGKVKTRLAATVGPDKAFSIYKELINHTYSITKNLQCNKIVYYSEYIEQNDVWNNYQKATQRGNDLGKKMKNAFKDVLEKGYKKTVIIGTDCFEINESIIARAFAQLDYFDIVIGPAKDGGYYLLGMKSLYEPLFYNIAWSTETVFDATVNACNQLSLNFFLLPVLNDIDEEKDLKQVDFQQENT